MNRAKKRYLMILFLTLCATGYLTLLSSYALAMEETSRGRWFWDNIMLWINFGILVFFFIKYAKKPLVNFLHGEQKKIEENIGTVEAQIKKAISLMDEETEKLKHIDEQLKKIKENIVELGWREKGKIIEKAKIIANQMLEDAHKESEYRLVMAKKRLSVEMLDIAISMAVERLKKEISVEDNEKIIDQFTSGLSATREILP